MNAMTEKQIRDAFVLAAQRQSKAIEAAIEDLRALSSFEGKLVVDVEALDEAFGERKVPLVQPQCRPNVYSIRA